MQSSPPTFTYEDNEVVAKTNTLNHLFISLFLLAVTSVMFFVKYEDTMSFFNEYKLLAVFGFFILSFSIIYSLIMYLDKRVKLVINKHGIWTLKNGQVRWDAIWYYHLKVAADKKRTEMLHIKLRDNDDKVYINLDAYDAGKDAIMNSFIHYTSQYSINDLGVDDENKSGFFG